MAASLNPEVLTQLTSRVEENLRTLALPALKKFIEIPNLSRQFDAEWNTNGLIPKASQLCLDYAHGLGLQKLSAQLYQDEGTTPFLFGVVEASPGVTAPKTVVVYGHIDKQPPLTEKWREGLHPHKAVEENGFLYGRGAVDDGYNWFAVLAILKAIEDSGLQHDRFILFFETDEESASKDIPHYLAKFRDQIGDPELMLCLDTSSISEQHFSIASSMRGIINFDVSVKLIENGVHSGYSGIAASSFRVMRDVLDRLEDSKTGKILIPELWLPEVPSDKLLQAQHAAKVLGEKIFKPAPFLEGVEPVHPDHLEAYLNRSWRPQLEIIGQEGIPSTSICGNVLREETLLRCSLRLPPTINDRAAFGLIKAVLEKDPPYKAKVVVTLSDGGNGFCAKAIPEQVQKVFDSHATRVFGSPIVFVANGSSIPFVSYLQSQLPKTMLMVSGAGLPTSMIHGPNEHLNIRFMERYMTTLAGILVEFAQLPPLNL